jgi:RNA polymerase sigma-B factor
MTTSPVHRRRTTPSNHRHTPQGTIHPTARQRTDVDVLDLFERWGRDRDAGARDLLVERYMPLARKLASRYRGANEPFDDLVQVASVGLVLAIDRFDPDRGRAFSSFAVPTILGELRRYFRDSGWSVHVPRAAQERALTVERAVKTITASGAGDPTPSLIAEYLEWPLDDVLEAFEAGMAHHSGSLNTPAHDTETPGDELLDTVPSTEEGYDRIDAELSLGAAIHGLPWQARRAIALRFTEDLTQAEIGARLGASQMQISRVLRAALADIRQSLDQHV